MLRSFGVVGAFVEFAGDGLAGLSLADRATIANMSPEFGATSTLFLIDDETLAYLRLTGRTAERLALVEARQAQGLWRRSGHTPAFDDLLTLDLASVEPSVAGPRRPQDRVPLTMSPRELPSNGPRSSSRCAERAVLDSIRPEAAPSRRIVRRVVPASDPPSFSTATATQDQPAPAAVATSAAPRNGAYPLWRFAFVARRRRSGRAVAIAAITSCTNTSNPTVMVGAGLSPERGGPRPARLADRQDRSRPARRP